MDSDGNGTIEKNEVIGKFRTQNGKANEAQKLFQVIDSDASGVISKQEFNHFWLEVRSKGAPEDKVIQQLDQLIAKYRVTNYVPVVQEAEEHL